MRFDTSVFLRPKDAFKASISGNDNVCVLIQGDGGAGDDVRLFFDSMKQAEALADVIYYLRMDKDAEAMQADQAVSSQG